MKSLAAVDRELKSLASLEIRVKQMVNPSKVLLAQIEKRRQELLNPKEETNASTQETPRK